METPRSILVLDERATASRWPEFEAAAVFHATGPLDAACYCVRERPDLVIIDPSVAWQRQFAESLSLRIAESPAAF